MRLNGKGGGRFSVFSNAKGDSKDFSKVIYLKNENPLWVEQSKSAPGLSKGPIAIENLKKEGFVVYARVPYNKAIPKEDIETLLDEKCD